MPNHLVIISYINNFIMQRQRSNVRGQNQTRKSLTKAVVAKIKYLRLEKQAQPFWIIKILGNIKLLKLIVVYKLI